MELTVIDKALEHKAIIAMALGFINPSLRWILADKACLKSRQGDYSELQILARHLLSKHWRIDFYPSDSAVPEF